MAFGPGKIMPQQKNYLTIHLERRFIFMQNILALRPFRRQCKNQSQLYTKRKGNRLVMYYNKKWNIKLFNGFQNNYCFFYYILYFDLKISPLLHTIQRIHTAPWFSETSYFLSSPEYYLDLCNRFLMNA